MDLDELKEQHPAANGRPVLITDVTRMRKGFFCVAGYDIHAAKMVRPLQPSGQNWQLVDKHLPFQVGELVLCVPVARTHGSESP